MSFHMFTDLNQIQKQAHSLTPWRLPRSRAHLKVVMRGFLTKGRLAENLDQHFMFYMSVRSVCTRYVSRSDAKSALCGKIFNCNGINIFLLRKQLDWTIRCSRSLHSASSGAYLVRFPLSPPTKVSSIHIKKAVASSSYNLTTFHWTKYYNQRHLTCCL